MWFTKRHSENTKKAVYEAFPDSLRDDVRAVLKIAGVSTHDASRGERDLVLVSGERVRVPARVYFTDVRRAAVDSLTQQQMAIFASLMTRHHDGHQREYWAKMLCRYPNLWTAPFLAELVGDYVLQILEVLDAEVGPEWEPIIKGFVAQNEGVVEPLNHRILNYWHLYYRWYRPNIRKFGEYPGYKVSARIGLWKQGVAKRLL